MEFPKVKQKQRQAKSQPAKLPRRPRKVGTKRIVYSSDYRRRMRHEGHMTSEHLRGWQLVWDIPDDMAAELLDTTEGQIRDIKRRKNSYLPKKVHNRLEGMWQKNPRGFSIAPSETRVYFKIERAKPFWALLDAYNWGFDPLDLIYFRYGYGGEFCRVVHRPSGTYAVCYEKGYGFDYNRRWATKKLADKYYGMRTVREIDAMLKEQWSKTRTPKHEVGSKNWTWGARLWRAKQRENSQSTDGEKKKKDTDALTAPHSSPSGS